MSRIERKVRSMVRSDAEMKSAIRTVLDSATDGEVQWVDVRDSITSGQWGRLIEKGILVDGESGFRLEEPAAIEAGLEEPSDDEEIEDSTWTKWDKGAGAVTLLMFAGYAWAPARNTVGNAVDVLFGPLVENFLPFYVVIMIIAVATGLYSTLLRVALMDMDKMGQYREQMEEVKERRQAAKERGDEEALDEIQEEQMEMMGDQLGMFKEQFRPMVWIMFLTIPAFLWMYWAVGYRGADAQYELQSLVIPFAGTVDWTTAIFGPIQVWIVWYFLCSMAFQQLIQKGLNISMTPSSG